MFVAFNRELIGPHLGMSRALVFWKPHCCPLAHRSTKDNHLGGKWIQQKQIRRHLMHMVNAHFSIRLIVPTTLFQSPKHRFGGNRTGVGGRDSFNWLENPRIPFHVFWKMLIPHSRFSKILNRSQGFSAHVFSNMFDFWDSEISENTIFQNRFSISYIGWNSLVKPKSRIIGLGSHRHVH